jgi:FMN phosphatase YigB (HAD superfamily)
VSFAPDSRRYDVVLFDFHGVLCHDYFYAGFESRYPDVHAFVERQVFGGTSDIVERWTRGELTSDDVNRFISAQTGMDFDVLSTEFRRSVAQMRVDARLIDLAARLRATGVAVGIVTGNMDVFQEIVVPRNALDQVFPVIVSSCDYGCLKEEENGRLFDVALEMLGRPGEYVRALLVDDSERSRNVFHARGGSTFPYTDFLAFHRWAATAFSLA